MLARLRDGRFATRAVVDYAVGDLLADRNTPPFQCLPG
jgi:hypothetical protein